MPGDATLAYKLFHSLEQALSIFIMLIILILKGGCSGEEVNSLSSERTRGNGLMLYQGEFRLNMKKKKETIK